MALKPPLLKVVARNAEPVQSSYGDWRAVVRAEYGSVYVRLDERTYRMTPALARRLAAALLVTAERAERIE